MNKNKNILFNSTMNDNEIMPHGQITLGNSYKYIIVLFTKEEFTYKKKKIAEVIFNL